jgi:hypothetical protein
MGKKSMSFWDCAASGKWDIIAAYEGVFNADVISPTNFSNSPV